MIKYMAYIGYTPTIEVVEAIRETDKFVYLPYGRKDRRVMKRSSYENYCDTWEEAHELLLADAQKRLDLARGKLQAEQGRYGNIKGMKKPAEVTA